MTLLDLWHAHRGAFEYDWRHRFGCSLSSIPEAMGWDEAWRLTLILAADPSTRVAAALAGWQYPMSREGLALLTLFDLQHASKAKKKPKAYPRPWDRKAARHGDRAVPLWEWQQMKEGRRV